MTLYGLAPMHQRIFLKCFDQVSIHASLRYNSIHIWEKVRTVGLNSENDAHPSADQLT